MCRSRIRSTLSTALRSISRQHHQTITATIQELRRGRPVPKLGEGQVDSLLDKGFLFKPSNDDRGPVVALGICHCPASKGSTPQGMENIQGWVTWGPSQSSTRAHRFCLQEVYDSPLKARHRLRTLTEAAGDPQHFSLHDFMCSATLFYPFV